MPSSLHKVPRLGTCAQTEFDVGSSELATLINSTLDCVLVLDNDCRVTFLNERAEARFGAMPDVQGMTIQCLLPGQDGGELALAIRRVRLTRKPEHFETYLSCLRCWFEAQVTPLPAGVGVFLRDISDRRLAQEEVIRHTERAFGILDQVPQIIFSCDADGACHYLSPQWADFTGRPIESGLGQGWQNSIHKSDILRIREKWRKAMGEGDTFELEYRARHHSGEFRWMVMRVAPRRSQTGRIDEWFGTCTDVHDRVLAQQSLVESEALNRSIIESSTDSIQLIDLGGRIRFANKLGPKAAGIDATEDLIGRKWSDLLSPKAAAKVEKMLLKVSRNEVTRFTIDELMPNGSSRWWDIVASPMQDAAGNIASVAVVSRDITYQKRSEERASWLAKHDALTNLPNRLYLQSVLDEMVQSDASKAFALLLLDIDNFKLINDTLGHDAGDSLLRAFAIGLKSVIRRADFIARLGGDEFAVVLTGIDSEENVQEVVATLQAKLREPLLHSGRILEGRASIGGVLYPVHGSCRTELLKHADIALYAAKASKDSFEMFRPAMRDRMQRRISMLAMAKDALRQNKLEPYYQPKVDLQSGALVGFEALLRLQHPVHGLRLPESISAAFEDVELAADISDRMIQQVISHMRDWLDRGIDFGHIAVNAAAAEFRRGNFAEQLLKRLEDAQVPAQKFQLEVTETVFLGRGAEYVERALKTLSAAGVAIALDDFGTGYASLSHLKQFPVDTIKIDRSFVSELGQEAPGQGAIVRAVINLGKSLNITVVAEGIETPLQEAMLKEYGCEYGQGFLYSKAVHHAQVESLISKLGSCPA